MAKQKIMTLKEANQSNRAPINLPRLRPMIRNMNDKTLNRRDFMARAGIAGAGLAIGPALLPACAEQSGESPADKVLTGIE